MLDQTHSTPATPIPEGACDCHMHVFGAPDRYPPAARRSYDPREASLAQWEAMAAAVGLQRQVFVQASCYGADNSCMLDAMRQAGARCRGVAVIDAATTPADLRGMHALGVRGVRINAATFGVQDPHAVAQAFDAAAAQVAPLGWHVQIFAGLPVIAALAGHFAAAPVPVVIDHMGLARAERGVDQPGFAALLALLRGGNAWIKLSGAMRVSDAAPDYADAAPIARALIAAAPGRAVWATDWPHTGGHSTGADGQPPLIDFLPFDDGHLLDIFAGWCADAAEFRKILVDNPARLYGF
jgi:predicted TIM-barrel fold metal-dependent hydrolase